MVMNDLRLSDFEIILIYLRVPIFYLKRQMKTTKISVRLASNPSDNETK
jgi:hypothetical protein